MNELNKRGRRPVPRLVKNDRLRMLIDEKANMGIPREKIAKEFGCDTSTITKHYNDNSPIDVEFLYKYANYFNVSADYLLGLSDVKSVGPNDRAICEKIGCSEETYKALRYLFNDVISEVCSFDSCGALVHQYFEIMKTVFNSERIEEMVKDHLNETSNKRKRRK